MSVPWQAAQDARGLLLVRGRPGPVTGWVRRGLVTCRVVPLGEWTALLPAERRSRAEPPYDDAVAVLAARPVPRRMRAALGLFVVGARAVVTVQPAGWRGGLRWLVWEPEGGVLRLPGLDPARPADIAGVAGRRDLASNVVRVVAPASGTADRVVGDLVAVLGLPGAHLLTPGDHDEGLVVAPTAQAVARFDHRMHEQARHRSEMEDS